MRGHEYFYVREALKAEGKRRAIGLYLHYPFCRDRCPYCHFQSSVYEADLHQLWLSGIQKEIQLAARYFSEYLVIETIYFGGGTPSLLKPEETSTLIKSLDEYFCLDLKEATIEINPEAELSFIRGWLQAGLTRLSFGAQSFDPLILSVLGRKYSPDRTVRLIEEARKAGANSINIDLMIGVPGESSLAIETNLDCLKSLRPEHISVYLLEEIGQVPFGLVWKNKLPADEEVADSYEQYRRALEESGWKQYEISNFSQPGYQCRHNLKYWRYQPFLGIGPSASSHLANFRWTNPVSMDGWLTALASGKQSFSEFMELKPEEELRECLAFGLRLREGVLLSELKLRFPGLDFSACETRSKQLAADGLLQVDNGRVRIRPEKFLISNSIIGELLY